MRRATVVLGALLMLGGCGQAAQRPAAKPAATVDPEIRALRAELAHARAERDAALARLRALQKKPTVVRVMVREPPPAAAHRSDASQPATQVFSNVTTGSASP